MSGLCRNRRLALQDYCLTKAGHTVGWGLGGKRPICAVSCGKLAMRVYKMHINGPVHLELVTVDRTISNETHNGTFFM